MKFIKEHITAIVISIICIVLLVLVFIAVYSMFNPSNSKDIYGSRLENEVIVSDSIVSTIETKLKENDIVSSVTYNKKVRIMKFIIDVKDDTKVEDSYKLGNVILENLSEDILAYYDVEVYITSNTDKYPMIGYKSKNAQAFTWTLNRGEVSE